MGLKFTYRHKDGATINIPVHCSNLLTDKQIRAMLPPSLEHSYQLLSSSGLVSYYFDWEYDSATYTDQNGGIKMWMTTKGEKADGS